MRKIHFGWFIKIWWWYYVKTGQMGMEKGANLICCDNGYQWLQQLICPYMAEEPCHHATLWRKVIECMFGIIKEMWRILNNLLQ